MALQTSGSMSISDINVELNKASSASLTTSDSDFLDLGDKSAGQPISIPSDFYGASAGLPLTFTVTAGVGYSSGITGFSSPKSSSGMNFGSINKTDFLGFEIIACYFQHQTSGEKKTSITVDLLGATSADFGIWKSVTVTGSGVNVTVPHRGYAETNTSYDSQISEVLFDAGTGVRWTLGYGIQIPNDTNMIAGQPYTVTFSE